MKRKRNQNTDNAQSTEPATGVVPSLSLSDEPSHDSRNGSTSQPTKTTHTLLCQQQRRLNSRSLCDSGTQRLQVCVCLCSQQHSFQLGPPSSNRMRAALPIRRRRCHQITQQLGSFAAQSSINLKGQRSLFRTVSLRFLLFHQLLQPLLVSTHFRCNVLRAGIAR